MQTARSGAALDRGLAQISHGHADCGAACECDARVDDLDVARAASRRDDEAVPADRDTADRPTGREGFGTTLETEVRSNAAREHEFALDQEIAQRHARRKRQR